MIISSSNLSGSKSNGSSGNSSPNMDMLSPTIKRQQKQKNIFPILEEEDELEDGGGINGGSGNGRVLANQLRQSRMML